MSNECDCCKNKQLCTKITNKDKSAWLVAGGMVVSTKEMRPILSEIIMHEVPSPYKASNLNISRTSAGGAGTVNSAYIYGGKTYTALSSVEQLICNTIQTKSNMLEPRFNPILEHENSDSFTIKKGNQTNEFSDTFTLNTRNTYNKSGDFWTTRAQCGHKEAPCEYDPISDTCKAT